MSKESFAALKKHVDEEENPEMKELLAMVYGSLLYSEYVSNVAPDIHRRAVDYLQDTHGLNSVYFDKVDPSDS